MLVIPDGGENRMAIHLTPTELGREAGMHRREVIAKCMELGVPIFQGRIDKTLFLSSRKEIQDKRALGRAKPPAGARRRLSHNSAGEAEHHPRVSLACAFRYVRKIRPYNLRL